MLKNPALLKQSALINGEWRTAAQTTAIHNPATRELVGTVPDFGEKETVEAIEAAAVAFGPWSKMLARDRSAIMRRWAELIEKNIEDLAVLMTTEQGKPLAEAKAELASCVDALNWFAEEGRRVYGDVVPTRWADKRIMELKQPIGVCAAITPWNFPAGMITRKAAAAIAAGCTLVLKPAPTTPFSAMALGHLALEAGLPNGVLNIITGDAAVIGQVFTTHPLVRKISFTGSTAVGKLLMQQSASTVKRLSLELGGHAPFIVFDDADIDESVKGAISSKYRNAGQTCVCANRIFVQETVYDAFLSKFVAATKALKVGNGLDPATDIGPLINGKALEKVEAHVADAIAKGAELLAGGNRHQLGGTFYEPTVLGNASMNMKIFREETFGPIAPVFRFKDEAEVIRLANDSDYGLAAYFYARDLGRVWRVAEALEYGIVGVNSGVVSTVEAPFGGMKQSGLGREGSRYGVDEYLEIKYCLMGGL